MPFNINKLIKFKLAVLAAGASGLIIVVASAYAAKPPAAPQGTMQAPPVTVQTVEESGQTIWSEYPGRLVAVDSAEIRPQVSGVIKDIKFDEGKNVKKGDVLFVIDPAPYEAAVAQAQADLNGAKSQSDFAQKELARAQDLLKTDAISKTVMDQRQNDAQVAKNAIDADEAKLRQAKINLDYAYVKAPISGRVGRAEITVGNLVQSGANAPLLTTIVANDKIYADFDVDEQTYLQNIRAGAQGIEAERSIPVKMSVKGDENKSYEGTIHSFDNSINAASGTIRARALFMNDDGALLPGMFATVKVGNTGTEKNILIPESVISTDQDRKFVYIVDSSNKVAYAEIKLGPTVDGKRVVTSGLKAGDRVIVDGGMRVRPDMVVTPTEAAPATASAAQPAAAAPAEAKNVSAPAAGESKPDDNLLKKVESSKDGADEKSEDKSQGEKQ